MGAIKDIGNPGCLANYNIGYSANGDYHFEHNKKAICEVAHENAQMDNFLEQQKDHKQSN
jgi:hypothetical protein